MVAARLLPRRGFSSSVILLCQGCLLTSESKRCTMNYLTRKAENSCAETLIDPPPHVPFAIRSFGVSDPGRVRPSNEDHFAIVELTRTLCVHQTNLPQKKAQYSSHRGHVLLVADGMGGTRPGRSLAA